jgi:hypothetical protein
VRDGAEDTTSNEVEVQIQPGQAAQLSCSTRPGFGIFNPLLIGRMFRPKLRVIEDHREAV